MHWSYNLERSRPVAIWLFAVAVCVVAVLVVGGLTRLTGSGLSITDWKPINGVIPPLNDRSWAIEFLNYQKIPQYLLLNRGMALADFKAIFWWEWAHRFLARLLSLIFILPFLVMLALRKVPARLVWRCVVILGLGALQGLVGWWMVASGLTHRTSVAPERLATHLGLALLLFSACVWTGFEAWAGRRRTAGAPPSPWGWAAPALAVLVYIQCLLGALVSGGRAGLIDGDWPLMGGRLFPEGYRLAGQGWSASLLHSLPAVQFNHRLFSYVLFVAAAGFLGSTYQRANAPAGARRWGHALLGMLVVQMLLGIATLRMGDPLWLAAIHQLGAVVALTLALTLAWRVSRT